MCPRVQSQCVRSVDTFGITHQAALHLVEFVKHCLIAEQALSGYLWSSAVFCQFDKCILLKSA